MNAKGKGVNKKHHALFIAVFLLSSVPFVAAEILKAGQPIR